jgi:hypothetical protein
MPVVKSKQNILLNEDVWGFKLYRVEAMGLWLTDLYFTKLMLAFFSTTELVHNTPEPDKTVKQYATELQVFVEDLRKNVKREIFNELPYYNISHKFIVKNVLLMGLELEDVQPLLDKLSQHREHPLFIYEDYKGKRYYRASPWIQYLKGLDQDVGEAAVVWTKEYWRKKDGR